MDRRLGWIQPKEKDARDWKLRSFVRQGPKPTEMLWEPGLVRDQDGLPWCVSFSGKALMNASPVRQEGPEIKALYDAAQAVDGIILPHDGTTVHAAAKVLNHWGYLKSYAWSETIEDVIDFVLMNGPVVLGIDWTEGMCAPDANGLIHSIGNIVGGHAVLLIGVNTVTGLGKMQNSWGDWGLSGFCYIPLNELGVLISRGGEACAAVEQEGPVPVPQGCLLWPVAKKLSYAVG